MHLVVFEDVSHVELFMRLHHIIPQWKLSEAKTASILYSLWLISLLGSFHFICLLQDCYLVYLLSTKTGATSMIFTRTCRETDFLALVLRKLGLEAIPINGQMSQVCLK